MPFISNDLDWKLVEDEKFRKLTAKYDGYVVAHRLFVLSATPFLSEQRLFKRFKKYGQIESVQLLKKPNEAYVTFKDDRNACLAFLLERNNGAEIAHTWKQPKGVEKQNDFPDEFTFEVRFDENAEDGEKFSVSLADARKTLRSMGPRLEKLGIAFLTDDDDDNEMIYKMAPRYFQQIAKYCTNVEEMSLEVSMLKKEFIQLLAPIFANLQKFSIWIRDVETDSNVHLLDFFPQLKKLTIDCPFNLVNTFKKPLLTLESITFQRYQSLFKQFNFFKLNPQLKCIKIGDRMADLKDLVDYVPNIEKISLWLPQSMKALAALKNLTKLTIYLWEFKDISESLAKLINLQQLKLLWMRKQPDDTQIEDNKSLIGVVQANQNLERLDLFKWNFGNETVVEIVRHAEKLKMFHLHNCEINATKSLIKKLVKERKSMLPQADKLQLFIDKDNKNDLSAIYDDDAVQYLDITWNCQHKYWDY